MSSNDPDGASPPPRGRGQFGLGLLFLLMLVVSVLAAVLGGLLQGGARRDRFVLLALAAPIGVMVLAGLAGAAFRLLGGRRRR